MTTRAVMKYSPEVRERTVRMVLKHQGEYSSQWAEIGSVETKIGCTAETLRRWVQQAKRDQGLHEGLTISERERLHQANEILRKASIYFAQAELDCRSRP